MFAKISYAGVFLAGFALLLVPGMFQEAQAETTVITPDTTTFPTVVEQGDILIIEEGSQAELFLENHGTVINRGTVFGSITNHESGAVSNEAGAVFGALVDNYGYFENRGDYASPQTGTFQNRATGQVVNYGYFDSHSMNVANEGAFYIMSSGTFFIFNGVNFDNSGTVGNAGAFYLSKTTDFNNISGVLYNLGQFYVGGYGTGSGSEFTNDAGSVVNNSGEMTNYDFFYNDGTFENDGTLSNRPVGFISPVFNNTGILNNNEGATLHNLDDSEQVQEVTVRNFGTLNNSASIINEGAGAVITNECGATFNDEGTVEGNPVVEECPSSQTQGPLGPLLTRFGNTVTGVIQ